VKIVSLFLCCFVFLRRDYKQKGDCVSPKLSHSTTRKQDKKSRGTHTIFTTTLPHFEKNSTRDVIAVAEARPTESRPHTQPQAYKKKRRRELLLLLYFCTNMERLIDQQRTRFLFCTCTIFIQKKKTH
jgi:hypothetical protein